MRGTTLWVVLSAVVLHGVLLMGFVAAYGLDVSALVCASQPRVGQRPFEEVTRGFGAFGYDGQFYYAIARQPWERHISDIDVPVRHLRILYPAACWLLSGGAARPLLWIMPLVNLLAIALMAWLGTRLARQYGMSPWWGLLLPLAVNAGLGSLRNLTDPVANCALIGLLTAWLLGWRHWVLCLWALAAVFSREQNLVIVGIIFLAAVWRRQYLASVGLAGVAALWLGWVGVLHHLYGEWPFLPSQGNMGAPLAGMLFRWTHLDYPSASLVAAILHFLRMLHLSLLVILALLLVVKRYESRTLTLLLLWSMLLVTMGGTAIYDDAWSYTRVFAWLPIGIFLHGMQARLRWALLALTPAALWPCVAVLHAWR
ncbi:MAG: hypothetical protein ACK4RK_12265 [Gemmataceae bacterium]